MIKDVFQKYLEALIQGKNNYKAVAHPFYKDSIELEEKIEDCVKTELPKFIEKTCKKEKKQHREYRKDSFENTLLSFFKRITNSLRNIRNADDYTVLWNEGLEGLDEYKSLVEKRFGNYGNLEEFFWNIIVGNHYINKPNSVVALIPKEGVDQSTNRDIEPFIVDADEVIDFQKGKFACLIIDEEVEYDNGQKGIKVLFIDETSYLIATQNSVKSFTYDSEPTLHHAGELPAFKIGKSILEIEKDGLYELFASEIQESLPHVRTALRRKSDLDIVNSKLANPKEWQFQTVGCDTCSSTGKVKAENENGLLVDVNCPSCGGSGKQVWDSSMDVLLLTPPVQKGFDDTPTVNIPTPPAGFVVLPKESVDTIRSEYNEEHDATYRSCGMEYLNYQPLSQSGKAKEQDSEEFKKILLDNEKHFLFLLHKLYKVSELIYTLGVDKGYSPSIPLAMRFDVTNAEKTRTELKDAINNNFPQALQDTFSIQLLDSRSGTDSLEYKQFLLQKRFDSFRGKSPQEKILMKSSCYQLGNRGTVQNVFMIKQLDKSLYFDAILNQCLFDNPKLFDLDLDNQIALMDATFEQYFANVLDPSQPIGEVTQLNVNPPVSFTDNNQNLK